jgi:hypothetical protein
MWLLTHSETAQFLILFPSIYLPTAFLRRQVEGLDEHAEVAAGLLPPWRLLILSLLLVAPAGIAIDVLSRLIELGLFWFIALMWAWIEIYATLIRREIEHRGTATWRAERPLRDAAFVGLLTVPIIAGMLMLFDGSAPLSDAIIAADPTARTGHPSVSSSHLAPSTSQLTTMSAPKTSMVMRLQSKATAAMVRSASAGPYPFSQNPPPIHSITTADPSIAAVATHAG